MVQDWEYTHDLPYRYQTQYRSAKSLLVMKADAGLWSPSRCRNTKRAPNITTTKWVAFEGSAVMQRAMSRCEALAFRHRWAEVPSS